MYLLKSKRDNLGGKFDEGETLRIVRVIRVRSVESSLLTSFGSTKISR